MSAEGVEATGGEGVTLTEDEREALWRHGVTPGAIEYVERIVAARVQQAEAERDDLMALAIEDTHRRGVVEAERDALRERVERAESLLPEFSPVAQAILRAALDGPR